ncbi:MAG: hypothetical protein L0H93_03860 [Nocardioides sp.]|nr:hypothetical protein [Nocardioides sp.]
MTSTFSDRVVRRAVRATSVGALLALAGAGAVMAPAGANTPEGWSNPPAVDPVHALVILLAAPVGLFLLIALVVYLPALARGENLSPSSAGAFEIEWFGGPSKSHEELAAPDNDESQSGGASGRW